MKNTFSSISQVLRIFSSLSFSPSLCLPPFFAFKYGSCKTFRNVLYVLVSHFIFFKFWNFFHFPEWKRTLNRNEENKIVYNIWHLVGKTTTSLWCLPILNHMSFSGSALYCVQHLLSFPFCLKDFHCQSTQIALPRNIYIYTTNELEWSLNHLRHKLPDYDF